jgi:antitoxin MazE
MKVKIAKWGNSLGLRLPKTAVEATGLRPGAEVDVVVEGNALRVTRSLPVKHYRLEDLLAEMDRLGPENRPALVQWEPVGAEVIDDDYERYGEAAAKRGGHRLGRPKAVARQGKGRRPARRRSLRS